jgi:hypothetical protein
MGKQVDLYKKWKRARRQLDAVFKQPEHMFVIHYSCESFYDRENNPRSPRVTSIAIRNLDTGQTKSFSIHLVAEREGMLDVIDQHYDQLERAMLEDFFTAARERQHCKWLHWNMRDANYGFEALENRLRALGRAPFSIPEANRVDLSRLLVSVYGVGYVGHPRLQKLMEVNHITARDFLVGAAEAAAFDDKEFVRLHQSTLRKVDVLANIASRAHSGELKTLSSYWEIHGRSVMALFEALKEHWAVRAVLVLFALGAGAYKLWPVARTLWH